jgi:hypothetical protein
LTLGLQDRTILFRETGFQSLKFSPHCFFLRQWFLCILLQTGDLSMICLTVELQGLLQSMESSQRGKMYNFSRSNTLEKLCHSLEKVYGNKKNIFILVY